MSENKERMALNEAALELAVKEHASYCLRMDTKYAKGSTAVAIEAYQAALATRQDEYFYASSLDLGLKLIYNPGIEPIPISIYNATGQKLDLKFDKDQTLIIEGDLPVSEAAQLFFDELKRIATRQGEEVGIYERRN